MRAMATTAAGRPPLNCTARVITAGGMVMPTVAMSTTEDWVGCASHLALLNRARAGFGFGSATTSSVRTLTGTSACIGGVTRRWADSGGLHVDGVHVGRVQDVGLLHVAEVNAAG